MLTAAGSNDENEILSLNVTPPPRFTCDLGFGAVGCNAKITRRRCAPGLKCIKAQCVLDKSKMVHPTHVEVETQQLHLILHLKPHVRTAIICGICATYRNVKRTAHSPRCSARVICCMAGIPDRYFDRSLLFSDFGMRRFLNTGVSAIMMWAIVFSDSAGAKTSIA